MEYLFILSLEPRSLGWRHLRATRPDAPFSKSSPKSANIFIERVTWWYIFDT